MNVHPAKTQISLGICPVWSESLLCTKWVAKDPSFLRADSKDSNQTGGMPQHDKTNKMRVHPAKTQISLGIQPVWSESSLGALSFCWFCHVAAHIVCDGLPSLPMLLCHKLPIYIGQLNCFYMYVFQRIISYSSAKYQRKYVLIFSILKNFLCLCTDKRKKGWATTWENVSSRVSDQARHKPACAATEAR